MTLSITLALENAIYQSSDFRLTTPTNFSDTSIKSLQVGGSRHTGWTWCAQFSYAGVGRIGTTDTSQWLLGVLDNSAHTISLDDAIGLIASSWTNFVAPARTLFEHTFVVGAFDNGAPRIIMLSNTSRLDPRTPGRIIHHSAISSTLIRSDETPENGSIYVIGSGASLIKSQAVALARRARKIPNTRHGANTIFEQLSKITKLAARRSVNHPNSTVSEGCWCTSVSPDGPSWGRAFGLPDATYLAPTLQYPMPNSVELLKIIRDVEQRLVTEAREREKLNQDKRESASTNLNATRELFLIDLCRQAVASNKPHMNAHRAVITNLRSNDVSIIDTARHEVLTSISVGSNPVAVAVERSGSIAYVTQDVNQPHEGPGSIAFIDIIQSRVIDSVEVGIAPCSLALSTDGSLLYVANQFSNDIAVIDTAYRSVIGWIAVGGLPISIAIDSKCEALYFADGPRDQVVQIDLISHDVVRMIPVGQSPNYVLLDSINSRLFVTNQRSNDLSIIDLTTASVIGTVPVRRSPKCVVLSPLGDKAYITCVDSNILSVVDVTKRRLMIDIAVGREPQGVDVDPSGEFVYIVNSGSNSVSVMDASRRAIIATVPVGTSPVSFGRFLA